MAPRVPQAARADRDGAEPAPAPPATTIAAIAEEVGVLFVLRSPTKAQQERLWRQVMELVVRDSTAPPAGWGVLSSL